MIHTNSYPYILIGLLTRLLVNVSRTYPSKHAKDNVKTLKLKLKEGGFTVTLAFMTGNAYGDMEQALYALPDDGPIGELYFQVIAHFKTFENVLYAEATTKQLYVLPTRRFNSDILLSDPGKLLKPGAFAKLEDIAKGDLGSAGRCILFGEATAAAFHLLRATESVLTSYYFHHRRHKRLPKPMWGPMTEQLRAKKSNKPSKTLLDTLDMIRNSYRNPTQHPTATYEIDGAQDLMGVCLDAIGKMADELSARG